MSAHRTDAVLIARRYATAIFALATDAGKQDVITKEIGQLAAAVGENGTLHAVLHNPLVSRRQKADILAALVAKGDALTGRALTILAEGGRAELVPDVAEHLRAMLSEHRSELVAVVTSARPLSDAVQKQLKSALVSATGKEVQIELEQNPDVLGGLMVQLGSLRLDATLAGALHAMRANMRAPVHS